MFWNIFVNQKSYCERREKWLSPDGSLIASIPNVRNHSVVESLLAGNWTYEPAGLLDSTHVCFFFARRDIQSLFEEAGYRIESLGHVPSPGHERWKKRAKAPGHDSPWFLRH